MLYPKLIINYNASTLNYIGQKGQKYNLNDIFKCKTNNNYGTYF